MMNENKKKQKWRLLDVKAKFVIVCTLSLIWLGFITKINIPWIVQLSNYVPMAVAVGSIFFIAIIPSFWYAFTLISFLIDSRPEHKEIKNFPNISILVCAYNEEEGILQTVESLAKQEYPAAIEIIVVDDGSTDKTVSLLKEIKLDNLIVLEVPHGGKAAALNAGLQKASNEYVVTIDADTYLLTNSVKKILEHILSSLPDTAAVAGTVCVRNSRTNLLTKVQEWNYFNEFISQKRIQSLFQATLVAQGAFSVFRKSAVLAAGGWKKSVGEDIVLTWALIKAGYRIGFCEESFSFTLVPSVYKNLFLQRSRWSQGMLEALSMHHGLLFHRRFTTLFIWWNLLIPLIDLCYGFIFLPGVVLALFGHYYIAGPMTISVIPLILLNNFFFFYRSCNEFKKSGLVVRKNVTGYIVFMFFYQPLIMVPAAIYGYFTYFLGKKKWGTKK